MIKKIVKTGITALRASSGQRGECRKENLGIRTLRYNAAGGT